MRHRPLAPPAPFVTGRALSPLPLFVYGTLLPGQPLAPVVAPYVRAHTVATMPGRLHWHACGGFPVLVPAADTVVTGLRLLVEPAPALLQFLAIDEIGFGYDARWCPVDDGEGRDLGAALVFCWPWGKETLGPVIAGDMFGQRPVLEAGYPAPPPSGPEAPAAPQGRRS